MAGEDKTTLMAHSRAAQDIGAGRVRRLRRAEGMPAVIYGGGGEPVNIRLAHKDMLKIVRDEALFTRLLNLEVDGKSETVILKQLQRHPAKSTTLLHADFQRVRVDQAINVQVPLRLVNADKCVGVKTDGGMLVQNLNELSIQCLPADLPEVIEIDVAELHLGHALHISDVRLPSGVSSTELAHGSEHDLAVVSVQAQRVMEEEEEAPAEEALAEGEEEQAAAEGEAKDDKAEAKKEDEDKGDGKDDGKKED